MKKSAKIGTAKFDTLLVHIIFRLLPLASQLQSDASNLTWSIPTNTLPSLITLSLILTKIFTLSGIEWNFTSPKNRFQPMPDHQYCLDWLCFFASTRHMLYPPNTNHKRSLNVASSWSETVEGEYRLPQTWSRKMFSLQNIHLIHTYVLVYQTFLNYLISRNDHVERCFPLPVYPLSSFAHQNS